MGRVSTQHGSQSMRGWCLRRRWRGRSKQQLNSELRYLEVGGGVKKRQTPEMMGFPLEPPRVGGPFQCRKLSPMPREDVLEVQEILAV